MDLWIKMALVEIVLHPPCLKKVLIFTKKIQLLIFLFEEYFKGITFILKRYELYNNDFLIIFVYMTQFIMVNEILICCEKRY